MANQEFVREKLKELCSAWRCDLFTDLQMKLCERELLEAHIEDDDVESAIYFFIKTKTGKTPLPSIEAICAEVEKQRSDRLANKRFDQPEHFFETVENKISSQLHLLHCKCTLEKIKIKLKTPQELGSPAAAAFEKICKSKVAEVDLTQITEAELNEFVSNAPMLLQVEFAVIASIVRPLLKYDPFAEP